MPSENFYNMNLSTCPKLIDPLPVIVKIAQKLIENNKEYKDDSHNVGQLLKCYHDYEYDEINRNEEES